MVRDLQRFREVVHEHVGAGIREGLEHGPDFMIPHRHDRFEGHRQFGGMVGIVVGNGDSVELTEDLEPSARSLEARDVRRDVFGCHSVPEGRRDHAEGVEDIVLARDTQRHMADELAGVHDVELGERAAIIYDVLGVVIPLRRQTEGQERLVVPALGPLDGFAGVLIVSVVDNEAGRHVDERGIGLDHVVHGLEVFHVVVIHVEEDGGVGRQGQEVVLELAGLRDHVRGVPRSSVAVDEGQPSADDEGRVLARLDHDLGQHGRRRGLAVGTADADAVVIHSGDGTKEVGTLEARDAGSLGGHQFGVVLEDGDGVDDDVRLAELDVLCLLAEDDLGAQGPELVDIVSGIVVGAGHVVAVGEKDLCQGRHAGTADPDEMDSFGCFQNVIDFQDRFLHKVARIPVLDYTKTPLIIKGLVSNKWNIPPFIIVLK